MSVPISEDTVEDSTNLLAIPRTNHSGHRYSKSGSSVGRLTRTNTDTTDLDVHSLRTIDKIPSVKPSVANCDKLWTQIDVLDDVRNMSNEIKSKGSFFNGEFSQQLSALKTSQSKLFETMYKQHHTKMNLDDQQKNLYNGPGDSANHGLQNADEKQQIVDDFFNEKPSREATYKKHNFKEMHEYIQEIKSDLTVVGESMKKFDDTINRSWST